MENRKMDKPTKYDMESMLPEYLFGGLNQDEINRFESALGDFPDIQKEIKDVRGVFTRLDAMDLYSDIPARTRNMSVKVQDRLNLGKTSNPSRSAFLRFAFPTFALVIMAYFLLFQTNFNKFEQTQIASTKSKISDKIENSIQNSDLIALASDSETRSAVQSLVQHSTSIPVIIDKTDLENINASQIDYLNNLVYSEFLPSQDDLNEYFSKMDLNTYNVDEDFENINESQFQMLMKELKNEKFNS